LQLGRRFAPRRVVVIDDQYADLRWMYRSLYSSLQWTSAWRGCRLAHGSLFGREYSTQRANTTFRLRRNGFKAGGLVNSELFTPGEHLARLTVPIPGRHGNRSRRVVLGATYAGYAASAASTSAKPRRHRQPQLPIVTAMDTIKHPLRVFLSGARWTREGAHGAPLENAVYME
jgi:hypothetical protein